MCAATSCMYRVAPLVEWPRAPELPCGMYRLSNLHATTEAGGSASAETAAVPDILSQRPSKQLEMLETRQIRLLEQLECLQKQMQTMRENLLSVNTTTQSVVAVKKYQSNDLPRDVVINVSPDHPPYSLLSLKKLLKINIDCHTHSSVPSLKTSLKEFNDRLTNSNTSNQNMNITLIWKNVGAYTELIVSSVPIIICGEVNVLRYIVSAISCSFSYSEKDCFWEIDSLLDICHKLQTLKTMKERQAVIRSLGTKLGKGKWIGGFTDMSIVDVAAWSIIKQLNIESELTDNMKIWLQHCESSVIGK
ncbi:aaRS-interacting multifunctional protein 2 isoform X2 [Arctopsyche grandis]|uniref:aaRS-interacting multifunctional protein 2 isoform X2 n=1 Tax=Arctopsyche grandis TaxID=121162 RepID=UPI00406D9DEC